MYIYIEIEFSKLLKYIYIYIYIKTGHIIVNKYMIGSGFSMEIYQWVWFLKILNIIYEWGCFENLSGTSVPKSIGRAM
jgi:hypothetical protein